MQTEPVQEFWGCGLQTANNVIFGDPDADAYDCGAELQRSDPSLQFGSPVANCDANFADYSAQMNFAGAVLTDKATWDGSAVCGAVASVDEWCRSELPCWDEPECPTFLEFLRVIEWTGGDSDYDFAGASVETDCSGENGSSLNHFVVNGTKQTLEVVFVEATGKVLQIRRDSYINY